MRSLARRLTRQVAAVECLARRAPAETRRLLYRTLLVILERQAARLVRSRRPLIVAVTGSVGKTSTTEAIAAVLSARYRVRSTGPESPNSHLSVPLVIFGFPKPASVVSPAAWLRILWSVVGQLGREYPYDALVLELGTIRPGQIARFMRYLRPDIAVVTAIQSVHLVNFASLSAILDEKLQVALGSRRVVLNGDDELLAAQKPALAPREVVTYGLRESDFWFEPRVRDGDAGLRGLLHLGGQEIELSLNVLGRHSLYAPLAAAAVGTLAGIEPERIRERLESFRPLPGRMSLLAGKNGSFILDDTFSASSAATIAALRVLEARRGRRLAILGLAGLGEYAEAKLGDVGRHCGGLDWLITVGSECQSHLAPAAVSAGLDPERVRCFPDSETAGRFAGGLLQDGDTVLVKGSQEVYAEEAVKYLLADPADARQLARQSPGWRRKKLRARRA